MELGRSLGFVRPQQLQQAEHLGDGHAAGRRRRHGLDAEAAVARAQWGALHGPVRF